MTPSQDSLGEAWRRGSLLESARTALVILGLIALQALLAVVWWRQRSDDEALRLRDEWTLLHLLVFLSACLAVMLVTQAERVAERTASAWAAWTVTLGSWLYLVLTFVVWCAAIWFDPVARLSEKTGSEGLLSLLPPISADRTELARVVAVATVVAGVALSLPTLVRLRRTHQAIEQKDELPSVRHAADEVPLTLAFSGGGIRAATFALGAWNALGKEPGVEPGVGGPRLVAVSGGSYLAAALSFVRRFRVDARDPASPGVDVFAAAPPQWTDVYAARTPEARRLRRHTRDLVEPRSQLVSGLLTLVSGAVTNLLVLVGFAWFTAWLLSWLYSTTGVLAKTAGPDDDSYGLSLLFPALFGNEDVWAAQRPDHPYPWVVIWSVPLLAAAVAVTLVLIRMGNVRRFDGSGRLDGWRRRAGELLSLAVGLGAAFLAVVVGVPALVFSLNHLALHNAPSATVASVIKAMGFADEGFCRKAALDSVESAYAKADARADLSLGTAQSVTAGACGKEVVVTVKHDTSDDSGYTPDQAAPLVEEIVAGIDSSAGFDVSAAITALVSLVTTLVLAVGRANSSSSPEELRGWRRRARTFFVSRLPFLVLVVTLGWLMLSWTFALTLASARPGAPVAVMLGLAAALLCAVFVDANATALHSYYRNRLSSAWAVARSSSGDAVQLPETRVYSFSELGDLGLSVVTTANVRGHGQAPTRRLGMPMVFSPGSVSLVDGDRAVEVPSSSYEASAGRGRVSIMAAVATSGAAVSPMAGRYSYGVAPFRVLLTLFNVRIGTWVPNPRWGARPPRGESWRWPRPWLIARPGTAQVFAEATGSCSVEDRWLYLSDGGHLDNTGLVEAVRLHAAGGRIVVVDASNDAADSWAAVGDAIGVVRADFGIDLVCVLDDVESEDAEDAEDEEPPQTGFWTALTKALSPSAPDEPAGSHRYMRVYEGTTRTGEGLEVMVVKAVRPLPTAPEIPESVRAFAARTPEFPRAATTRQDFGDVEFEAYRALGEYYTRLAWDQWQQHRREARSTT